MVDSLAMPQFIPPAFGLIVIGLGAIVMSAPIALMLLGFHLADVAERAARGAARLAKARRSPGRTSRTGGACAPGERARGPKTSRSWVPAHIRDRVKAPARRAILIGTEELANALGATADGLGPILRAAEASGLARIWADSPDGPLVALPSETAASLGLVRRPDGTWCALRAALRAGDSLAA